MMNLCQAGIEAKRDPYVFIGKRTKATLGVPFRVQPNQSTMSLRRRDPPSALVKTKNYLPRATDDLERQFEDFYLKLCAKLYAYARAFMSDHDAEDLVHTTITNLWERWPVLALENPTKALFFRSVHNAIVDVLSQAEDAFITETGMTKGSMQLMFSPAEAECIYRI